MHNFVTVVALLGIAIGGVRTADATPPSTAGSVALTSAQIAAADIRSEALKSGEAEGVVLAGRVVPRNADVEMLPAPTAGVVRGLKVNTLDHVAAGQVVAVLFSSQALALQREFLDAASAGQLAQAAAQRDRQLVEKGIIAGRRGQESAAAARQADARLRQAREALRVLGIDAAEAERLRRSGKISPDINVRAGTGGDITAQLVTVGDQVDAGAPLFRLVRPGPRLLELQAAPDQVGHIRPGASVSVAGCAAEGRVSTLGASYQAASQSIMVRAEFPAEPVCFRPDQYVQARVAVTGGAAAALPEAAVFRYEGHRYVFLREGDAFRAVPVDGAGSEALVPGAQVVIKGVAALKAALAGIGS